MKLESTIALTSVVYDVRARDGTWCKMPYKNHPKGCPNYPKCLQGRLDFSRYTAFDWVAVLEYFDLKTHAERMKEKHPDWSERQCRNLLYWQGGVRKRLRKKAQKIAVPVYGDVILDIPEANGVDVYKTMEAHGVTITHHKPDTVIKVMFVGKKRWNNRHE